MRERVRYLHYSLKTEKAYPCGIRFFIRWNAAQGAVMRHPKYFGTTEVEAFLSMPANERKVSVSTRNLPQAAVVVPGAKVG